MAEVRNSGNRLTPEEIAARQKEFKKIQESGHIIELTTQSDNPKNSGVSYDYMNRLNQDIEAGIFEDIYQDGFTKQEKKALGKEIESVFTEHKYNTDFKNMHEGETYKITYDEYIKLAEAAGYKLNEKYTTDETQMPTIEASTTNTPKTDEYNDSDFPRPYDDETGRPYDMQGSTTRTNEPEEAITENNPKTDEYNDSDFARPYDDETGRPYDMEGSKTRTNEPEETITENNPKTDEYNDSDFARPYDDETGKPYDMEGSKTRTNEPEEAITENNPKTDGSNDNAKTTVTKADAVTNADAEEKTEPEVKINDPQTVVHPAPKEVSVYNNTEEELNAFFDNDSELADKDGKERAQIMSQRISDLNRQIYDLEKTTETYTTRKILFFGGKTKVRNIPEEEVSQRQAQAEQLKQEKDELMRYGVYAKEVLASDYWNGAYAPHNLVDEDGNILEQHGTHKRVIVQDADGNEHRALAITTYKDGTSEMKYYPIDVRKVGDPNMGPGLYWNIVPDKEHELVGYTAK